MPVRYDPLLLRALAREISDRWAGTRAVAVHMDAGRRALALELEGAGWLAAVLRAGTGFLVSTASSPVHGPGWRETRFRNLSLGGVAAAADERALVLELRDARDRARVGIALELRTNHLNALLLDALEDPGGEAAAASWRIRHALWTRDVGGRSLRPGAVYSPPESSRAAIEEAPDPARWRATLEEGASPSERRAAVLRRWAWTSALNVDWILAAAEGDGEDSAESPAKSGSRGGRPLERYLKIRDVAHGRAAPDPRLIERRWGLQPYPLPLGHASAPATGTLLDGLERALHAAGGWAEALGPPSGPDVEPADDATELEGALRAARRRLRRRVAALERQLEGAASPDEPRSVGHLLLARKGSIRRGSERVRVPDFDDRMREIELDPALDVVSNAERYFAEARRRERARERIPEEIAAARAGLERVAAALAELREGGATEELWEVAGGRPRDGGRSTRAAGGEEARSPYTVLRSSGGLEIRVGRGAKDNDDLTFHHSAPDDIWLHAHQASGAHVILRWGRREENPPRRDLLEAAVAAAVNSAARHSGTVPVVWTRRKYVRKPRKSPPGVVLPDRVETIFVKPDEALVRGLGPDG